MTPNEFNEIDKHPELSLSTADIAANGPPANRPMQTSNLDQSSNVPLFPQEDTQNLRSQWEKVQIGFVDEPKSAVAHADELVGATIQRLADSFAAERSKLEAEWDKTDNVSTEDLRVALRRYRSFFDRLLSV